MTFALATINPAYAARLKRLYPPPQEAVPRHQPQRPVYASLPSRPDQCQSGPGLTSLYHFAVPENTATAAIQAIVAATLSRICCVIFGQAAWFATQ